MGLVLAVVVTAASVQDRDGAKLVLKQVKAQFSRLQLLWADGAYKGQLIDWGKEHRLSKDYEFFPEHSEAFIYVAMIRLMTKRLART